LQGFAAGEGEDLFHDDLWGGDGGFTEGVVVVYERNDHECIWVDFLFMIFSTERKDDLW
jgi:hypothetical protein